MNFKKALIISNNIIKKNSLILISMILSNLIYFEKDKHYIIMYLFSFIVTYIPIFLSIKGFKKYIKPRLLKLWAKELIENISGFEKYKSNYVKNLSLDENNKLSIFPLEISWSNVYTRWPNNDLNNAVDNSTLTKILYKYYISPIHNWCINNFEGDFYLWHDKSKVYLLIINPVDKILWSLIWDDKIPDPNETIFLKNII